MRWRESLLLLLGLGLLHWLGSRTAQVLVERPARAEVQRAARSEAQAAALRVEASWDRFLSAQRTLVARAATESSLVACVAADAGCAPAPWLRSIVALSGRGSMAAVVMAKDGKVYVADAGQERLGALPVTQEALAGISSVRVVADASGLMAVSAAPVQGGKAAIVLSAPMDEQRFRLWLSANPLGTEGVLVMDDAVALSTLGPKAESTMGRKIPADEIVLEGATYQTARLALRDDGGVALQVVGLSKYNLDLVQTLVGEIEILVFVLGGLSLLVGIIVLAFAGAASVSAEDLVGAGALKSIIASRGRQDSQSKAPAAAPKNKATKREAEQDTQPQVKRPQWPPGSKDLQGAPGSPSSLEPPSPTHEERPKPSAVSRAAIEAVADPAPFATPLAVLEDEPKRQGPSPAEASDSDSGADIFQAIADAALSSAPVKAVPASSPSAPPGVRENEDLPIPVGYDGPVVPPAAKEPITDLPGLKGSKAKGGGGSKKGDKRDLSPANLRSSAPANASAGSMDSQDVAIELPGSTSATPSSAAPGALVDERGGWDMAAVSPFDEQHYRQVFEEFVGSKSRLGEATENITFDGFSAKLRTSERSLIDRHGCRAVRFQVLVKGGQVSLRPQLVR